MGSAGLRAGYWRISGMVGHAIYHFVDRALVRVAKDRDMTDNNPAPDFSNRELWDLHTGRGLANHVTVHPVRDIRRLPATRIKPRTTTIHTTKVLKRHIALLSEPVK
jgi:hypothetical protein